MKDTKSKWNYGALEITYMAQLRSFLRHVAMKKGLINVQSICDDPRAVEFLRTMDLDSYDPRSIRQLWLIDAFACSRKV